MDVDGSGSLDTMELASALRARFGVTASIAELTRMLSAADTDGNGTLEVDEFEDVVRDVLAKAADRAVRVGQPPRQAELQRGRRHSLGRAAQRVEESIRDALGAAAFDVAERLVLLDGDGEGSAAAIVTGLAAGPALSAKVADLFDRMDVGGIGAITGDAFATVMRRDFGVVASREDLAQLIEAADADGNGTLECDELEGVVLEILFKAREHGGGTGGARALVDDGSSSSLQRRDDDDASFVAPSVASEASSLQPPRPRRMSSSSGSESVLYGMHTRRKSSAGVGAAALAAAAAAADGAPPPGPSEKLACSAA